MAALDVGAMTLRLPGQGSNGSEKKSVPDLGVPGSDFPLLLLMRSFMSVCVCLVAEKTFRGQQRKPIHLWLGVSWGGEGGGARVVVVWWPWDGGVGHIRDGAARVWRRKRSFKVNPMRLMYQYTIISQPLDYKVFETFC